MIFRHHTDSHHRGDDRNVCLFRKLAHLGNRVSENDASADADQRMLRLVQQLQNLCNLNRISLCVWLVAAQVNLSRLVLLKAAFLNIDRNINQNRSLSSGIGDIECLFDNSGNIRGVLHKIAVLHKCLRGSCGIHLLKDIVSEQLRGHLTGYGNQRHAVRVSRGQRCHKIRRAGTGCCNADPRLSCHSRVTAGRMTRALFCSDQYVTDFCLLRQTVIKRSNGYAGISETHGNPLIP